VDELTRLFKGLKIREISKKKMKKGRSYRLFREWKDKNLS
jgi:hypothetical protein